MQVPESYYSDRLGTYPYETISSIIHSMERFIEDFEEETIENCFYKKYSHNSHKTYSLINRINSFVDAWNMFPVDLLSLKKMEEGGSILVNFGGRVRLSGSGQMAYFVVENDGSLRPPTITKSQKKRTANDLGCCF